MRRTERRKSQTVHFQEFCESCAQNKASEISTMHFHKFWDSCAQNKMSEISTNAPSGILGLPCVEQHVGNLNKWTFMNSWTPVRRTRRRKSQKMNVQQLWDSCAQNKTSEIYKKLNFQKLWDSCAQNKTSGIQTKTTRSEFVGLPCAEQNVEYLKKCTVRISGTLAPGSGPSRAWAQGPGPGP